MQFEIDPEISWDLPEGTYPATLLQAGEYSVKGKAKARLVFAIQLPTRENVEYRVQKQYEPTMKKDSELRRDISTWLGDDFLRKNKRFDLKTLEGRKALVRVVRITNAGYARPLVWVSAILPLPDEYQQADAEWELQPMSHDSGRSDAFETVGSGHETR